MLVYNLDVTGKSSPPFRNDGEIAG